MLAALLLGACVAAPGASTPSVSGSATNAAPDLAVPADVMKYQNVQPAAPADLATVTVSEADARATAKANGATWTDGEAYIGRLNGFGVAGRLAWILRYPGISVVGPGPGVGSPPPPFNVAFYFVDAQNGAFLGATMATE
jgi:hypothetical protein